MPLYEYECSKCRALFEILQRVNDPPPKKCLKCGGRLKKVISPPAIQFKGSGWYVTDYAQKNSTSQNSQEKKKPDSKEEPQKKDAPSSSSDTNTE